MCTRSSGLFLVALAITIVCMSLSESFALEGTALLLDEGALVLYDMATGQERILAASGIGTDGGRFSPDGRKVAVQSGGGGRLHIFNIDGSGDQLFADLRLFRPLHWHGDYVYTTRSPRDGRGMVCRADIRTGTEDTIYTVPWDSTSIPSLHFTRDASIGYAHVRYDLTGVKSPLHYVKHCSPGISPSGTYITRNAGGHTAIYIHYRDTLENCCPDNLENVEYNNYGVLTCMHDPCVNRSYHDTIHVPGVWHARYVTVPHAGDNWMTAHLGYSGEDTSYIVDMQRKEYHLVLRKGNLVDFWPGALPTSDTPIIALDKTNLAFSSEQTVAQTVTMTNDGGGTLGTLTIDEDASWLTITVEGSGNTQQLVNSVVLDGLTEPSYTCTVTVGGGSATNTKTYTVVLSIGATVAAPTDFAANAVGGPVVVLSWTDNAAGETGYAIERATTGSDWQQIAVTDSNVTSFRDTGRADGATYQYRMRTVKGSDYSVYAGPVTVEVPLYPVITITGPAANTTWQVGDTAHVTWTARNCDQVDIIFSMNGGRTWTFRPTGDTIGNVQRGDSLWGDVPLVVPDQQTSECYVQVLDYNDPGYNTRVGPIAIVPSSGVRNRAGATAAALRFEGSVPLLYRGGASHTFLVPAGSVVGIYRVDGSHVVDIRASGTGEVSSVVWNGRNGAGRPVGHGCYVALIRKGNSSEASVGGGR